MKPPPPPPGSFPSGAAVFPARAALGACIFCRALPRGSLWKEGCCPRKHKLHRSKPEPAATQEERFKVESLAVAKRK